MPARKVVGVDLPREVRRVVKPNGRAYYYWHPHRGTKRAEKPVALGSDPHAPEFWETLRRLTASAGRTLAAPAGSIGWLVTLYRASEAFKGLAASSQASYGVSLDRFCDPDGWGHLSALGLEPKHVLAQRDAMTDTPVAANHMLSVGRTVWAWGAPLGHLGRRPFNPFESVPDLYVPDRGHVPWPAWVQEAFARRAPADLVRMMRLAIMTCQRESDFVRLGPPQRDGAGIWCRPVKTKRKRRAFRIPLATADAFELDRWAHAPILFENTRWKEPIARARADLYLFTPRAQPYTPIRLRARYGRFLASAAGEAICQEWKGWLADQIARYDWDIDPENVRGPTIHGLRGTGVLVRLGLGYDAQQISNDIGMSLPMVQRYIRFRDQVEVAEAGRRKLRLIAPDT